MPSSLPSSARGDPVTMNPRNIATLADKIIQKYQDLHEEDIAFGASKKGEFLL